MLRLPTHIDFRVSGRDGPNHATGTYAPARETRPSRVGVLRIYPKLDQKDDKGIEHVIVWTYLLAADIVSICW